MFVSLTLNGHVQCSRIPSQRYPSQRPQSAARPTGKQHDARGGARQCTAALFFDGSTAIADIERCLPHSQRLESPRASAAPPHRRRASRAPGADRRRERRAAGRVDGDLGAGARVAAGEGRRDRGGGVGRRGRQPVVHAARRLRPGRPHRRPHRLGAERRLARRRPQRRGRGRGAAPDRRRGNAAGHRAARQLGRRGRRPVRPLALRLVRGGRLDGRPGRAARAQGRRRDRAARRATRARRRARPRARRAHASSRARPPTSSSTSSRDPCSSRSTFRSASSSGTFGVERHQVTFRGQAAHAGSTPMDKRRDALAGAARLELEIREIAKRTGDGAVCTMGGVVTKPGIVTSVVETAECLLDQRHLDAGKLAAHARRGQARVGAVRARRGHRGRVAADLEHRADPLRRGADRARRRGDQGGRGRLAPPAERAAARRGGGRAGGRSRR